MTGGGKTKLVGVSVENKGTTYETMYDADEIHYYTTRDFGRVTGSAHDKSDPRCLRMPFWYDAEDIYKERSFNAAGNLVPELRLKVTELDPSTDKNKDGEYLIYLRDLEAGFNLMQTFGRPKGYCWRDFLNENEDAITADVWFQLAVFGEVVYG